MEISPVRDAIPPASLRKAEDEFTSLQVDVLSARCTAHRLKMREDAAELATKVPHEQMEQLLLNLQEIASFVMEVMNRS